MKGIRVCWGLNPLVCSQEVEIDSTSQRILRRTNTVFAGNLNPDAEQHPTYSKIYLTEVVLQTGGADIETVDCSFRTEITVVYTRIGKRLSLHQAKRHIQALPTPALINWINFN